MRRKAYLIIHELSLIGDTVFAFLPQIICSKITARP